MPGCCKKSNKVNKNGFREFSICEFDLKREENQLKLKNKDIRFDSAERGHYPKNVSKIAKYNWVTFLPLGLIYQFQKYSNIYFAACMVPSFFKAVSMGDWRSDISPFAFIMFVALLREFIEDIRRHKSD